MIYTLYLFKALPLLLFDYIFVLCYQQGARIRLLLTATDNIIPSHTLQLSKGCLADWRIEESLSDVIFVIIATIRCVFWR